MQVGIRKHVDCALNTWLAQRTLHEPFGDGGDGTRTGKGEVGKGYCGFGSFGEKIKQH